MDLNKVNTYINNIEHNLAMLRNEIYSNPHINVKVNGPATVTVGNRQPEQPATIASSYSATKQPKVNQVSKHLSAVDALNDYNYPSAIEPDMLADRDIEDDMIDHAEQILDFSVDCSLNNVNFLDYGCGEGYVAWKALDKGAQSSTGYDIRKTKTWEKFVEDKLIFTDKKEDLKSNFYDVVFLYDVIDHAVDPQGVLYHISKLIKSDGVLYVRCHPWTSRHGGHLYRKLNKAFAHLILSNDQIKNRDLGEGHVHKILRPIKTYQKWFEQAGFKIRKEDQFIEPLENYIKNDPMIWAAITKHFSAESQIDDSLIAKILEISFVDYVLQPNNHLVA